ncbi:MAG: YdbH domain-containing protein, partial [Kiritimatiellae bacterium]|nr:YdbH domain-containing protein [Kiritimatiellia bacterium]
ASLPDGRFDLSDPVVGPLAAAFSPEGFSLGALSGAATGVVECAMSPGAAVPEWNVGLRVFDLDASGRTGDSDFSLRGGRCWLPVKGWGAHWDVKPFGILFDSASAGGLEVDRGSFWFRADLDTLLLTEGSLRAFGGTVRVYALHLALESLDAGFTLLLDNLDTGEVLKAIPGVAGRAEGKLYGKLPLSVRGDGTVFLRDAFLYSPPGEIGRLELDDASAVTDNLAATGVPPETCADLSRALANLDYTALRLDLAQDHGTGRGRLSVRLDGSAKEGKSEIPVKLELAFNGELQDMLNLGIKAAKAKH